MTQKFIQIRSGQECLFLHMNIGIMTFIYFTLSYDKVALVSIKIASLNLVENSFLRKIFSNIDGSFPEKILACFSFASL